MMDEDYGDYGQEDYGYYPTMSDYYGGQQPAASYTYTNADFPSASTGAGDWYSQAAADYNSNPYAATSSDGGPAWRPYVPTPTTYTPMPAAPVAQQQPWMPQQYSDVTQSPGSRAVAGRPPGDVSTMGRPYAGGAGSYMTNAGYSPMGQMPQELMNLYKNFLSNPASMMDNPMFKAMMDQGLQATERKGLSQGFMNSGNMAQALQNTGIGTTAGYLGQIADIFKGGAGTEANRFGVQAGANQNAGQLGIQQYGTEANSQLNNARANYGAAQDYNAQLQSTYAQSPVQQLMTMMLMKQLQGG